jgi:hypothetical protein
LSATFLERGAELYKRSLVATAGCTKFANGPILRLCIVPNMPGYVHANILYQQSRIITSAQSKTDLANIGQNGFSKTPHCKTFRKYLYLVAFGKVKGRLHHFSTICSLICEAIVFRHDTINLYSGVSL